MPHLEPQSQVDASCHLADAHRSAVKKRPIRSVFAQAYGKIHKFFSRGRCQKTWGMNIFGVTGASKGSDIYNSAKRRPLEDYSLILWISLSLWLLSSSCVLYPISLCVSYWSLCLSCLISKLFFFMQYWKTVSWGWFIPCSSLFSVFLIPKGLNV